MKKSLDLSGRKHVTPHSFSHMHITYMQNESTELAMRDIMERVGNANYETTVGNTHRQTNSQEKAVKTLNNFIEKIKFFILL